MTQQITSLVTIITPTYNLIENARLEWFKQNIESVQDQTYPFIEHLVIDGGSTDGTIDVLEQYQKEGLITYYSQKDKGIYDALNRGILKAKGKYVVCLNSDDYYFSNKAVELEVTLLEKTKADACYADTMGINAKDDSYLSIWSGKDTFFPPFGEIPNHQTFMIKTSVMKELGLYNTDYRVSADSNFIYKMIAHDKKFVYVPETLVGYRSGGYSDQNHVDVLKDQERSFQEFFATKLGLTEEEIHLLAHNRFLSLELEKAISLGSKLKRPDWIEAFFSRYLKNKRVIPASIFKKEEMSPLKEGMSIRYKFFDFLYFFKIKRKEHSIKAYLFGKVPILCYKKKGVKKVLKVLFCPLFKERTFQSGKMVKYYVLNIPFLKVVRKVG